MVFCSREPDVIQLYEGCDSAVVGEASVMIGMEQVVGDEVLKHLVKHCILHQLADSYNVGHWTIVFGLYSVILLVK